MRRVVFASGFVAMVVATVLWLSVGLTTGEWVADGTISDAIWTYGAVAVVVTCNPPD